MVYRIRRMLAAVQILTNLPGLGHDQEMLWNHFAPLCRFMLEYCKEGECLTVFKPHIISQVPCGSAKGGGEAELNMTIDDI